VEKERVITIAIRIGLFGGLVGGPVASLADYYAPPEKGSGSSQSSSSQALCLVLLVRYDRSRKRQDDVNPLYNYLLYCVTIVFLSQKL
jgi:hypothetical protein